MACTVLASASVAQAQVGADVARRSLIDAASVASREGDHPRAIELATRALALRATPSLQLFLAREHLRAGHAVEALALAGACATRARGDQTVPDRAAMLARCEALAGEAERGVARLTLRVASPAPDGLRVTVRGEVVATALYDVSWPLAPGDADVDATAEGYVPFHRAVALVAGGHDEVTVTLAAREPVAPPAVVAPVIVTPPVTPRVTPPPRVTLPSPRSPSPAPWVLAGLGAAGIITGAVLGALALDQRASRDASCPSTNDCDGSSALAHDGQMRDLALGANVSFAVGGALVAGGLAWWLVARLTRGVVTPAPTGLALRW